MDWETRSVFARLVRQTSRRLCVKNKAQLQGDQNASVHLMITVQKKRKNILKSLNHLP
jgi:hypothetical protein